MKRDIVITNYACHDGASIIAESLSRVEICRQDMAEEGFTDQEMATAFLLKVMECMERSLPNKEYRDIWYKAALRID